MQDIESDTGYDTRRRGPDGAFAGVSQTTVYDTCGSAPPASQQRMAPSRWTCSASRCRPQASAPTAPGLDSCVRVFRAGDVLVVWKLDRSRSTAMATRRRWAVLQSVAPMLGCTAETLRKWVR